MGCIPCWSRGKDANGGQCRACHGAGIWCKACFVFTWKAPKPTKLLATG